MSLTPWENLRALTPARIALGRAGVSLPTAAHLAFQLDHARARKAVHLPLDIAQMEAELGPIIGPVLRVESAAPDRATYLQRPDLGRQLTSDAPLWAARGAYDLAIVVADGLSATAIHANAAGFLAALKPALKGLTRAPLVIARQARVAIGDEIGAALGARVVIVLIGERPGLSSPDSLGLYLTHSPRKGLTDEGRNCISNIRAAGLSYPEAAHKTLFLLRESLRRGLSGVALKDEADSLAPPARANFLTQG